MKFPESKLAHEYLDGKHGIEIGASAHNPFAIPGCIYVDYTKDLDTVFKQEEVKLCGNAQEVQVEAFAWDLPFPDESLDYVLSSHLIEHCWDVLGTLNEWFRVLKPGGIIFMIIPHKERTFDIARERTPYAELVARASYEELIRKVEGLIERPAFEANEHFSVWVTADWEEICEKQHFNYKIWDKDDKVGNGMIVVLQK